MSTYAASLAAAGRVPLYVVELETPKRCANTYASAVAPSTCTAADAGDGARCYFSYHTCQDTANFRAETKTWRFVSRGLPLPLDILEAYSELFPSVVKVSPVSQNVDIEAGWASTDKVKVTLADLGGHSASSVTGAGVADCPPFDLDKSVRNTGRAGTWWRRWLAQWPHFRNMVVRIKRGFCADDFPTSELTTIWEGSLEDVSLEPGGDVTLHAVGLARLLDKRLPPAISTTNVLQADVSRTATSWTVADASEYTDPSTVTGSVYVRALKTDGEYEIAELTGVNTGTDVLTVTRAQQGTTAGLILAETYVQEVLSYVDERPLVVVQDIAEKVGIASSYLDTTQLAEAETYFGPSNVSKLVTEPTKARDLVTSLLEPFMACVYQGENLKLRAFVLRPAKPAETITTITDTSDIMVRPPPRLGQNERQRLTHCAVYYDFPQGSTSESEAGGIVVSINNDGWIETYFGNDPEDMQGKKISGTWIASGSETVAAIASLRWALLFGLAPVRFAWSSELKDAGLEVGDLVDVTTADILDAHGAQVSTRMMIVKKEPVELHSFRFEAMPTGYATTSKWAFIAPNAAPDWGAASASDKQYGYIGDASNLLSGATGYLII